VTKARRGRRRQARTGAGAGTSGPAREHWRADGSPKTRFPTAADANRASLRFRLELGADLDPYQCRLCSGWHLGTHRD
jgi:hypothetical protein